MSSKTAKKTSSIVADKAAAKKMVVSFTSDSDDDDDEKSSSSSSSSSSESSSSSSSDESDTKATKSKFAKTPTPTPSPPPTKFISAEEDDVETVSFTLSLNTAHNDDSASEELKTETKITTEKEKKSESVPVATAVTEQLDDVKQSSSRKSPDPPLKQDQDNDTAETKKTTSKKSAKTATKSSAKVAAVNGGESRDETTKAAAEIVEKATAQPESVKKSADDTETAVNGETKTATKTVKKKTKKVLSEVSAESGINAAAAEEKAAENVIQKQTSTKTESTKPPVASKSDETPVVVNGETQSITKVVKKKVKKQSETSTTAVSSKEKESSSSENVTVSKSTTEGDSKTAKSEPVKTSPAAETVNEEPKPTVKTTVVKKKTKKVASEASSKSSDVQPDTTVSAEISANSENSAKKVNNDVDNQKKSDGAEGEKAVAESQNTVQEATSSGTTDKDSSDAAVMAAVADKTITKKKKVKKTTPASSTVVAESGESAAELSVEPQKTRKSPVDIEITLSPADDEVSENVSGAAAVHVVSESAVRDTPDVNCSTPHDDISSVTDATEPAAVAEKSSPVSVPITATRDEKETTNVVTLVQLDDNEVPTQNSAPLEVVSTETKTEVNTPIITSMDTSGDAAATNDSLTDSKNEESDFSYRRKSMDDFIKRILAEAREEQQKRMNPTANGSSDTGILLDLESANDIDKLGPSLSPTSKETSMLDRRLASTDRKRIQQEELGERTSKNATEDVDLDQDLAEIGRYFAKRNPTGITSKYDAGMENNVGDWISSRSRDVRDLENDSSTIKSVVNGQQSRAGQPLQNGATEDSFVPRAREETADVVRNSSRPVRAIIDQQTDVIQLLKSTGRAVDDLDAEIRSLRATFLDRQARIETLRTAVDAEVRAYQADQHAANDRIQQQQIPGGHFVRDEFMRANNIGTSYRSSAIEDLLGGTSPRRRSGSVSSTSGIVGGAAGQSGLSSSDLDYKSSALNSWVLGSRPPPPAGDHSRRNDIDDDASSTASGFSVTRSRRGGSVARERSYFSDDPVASRWDSPSAYTFGETSTRSTLATNYSPLTSSSFRSYYQSDYGSSPSSLTSTSYYGAREIRGYQGSGDSTGVGYSPFSRTATNDPSRFRRAQSVSDVTSDRSLGGDRYNAASSSSSYTGQFQSRFLDKVRGRKAQGDDQYRSRFLNASDSSSTNRYYSGRRGYSSND